MRSTDFRIQNAAGAKPEIFIYDEIGPEWWGLIDGKTVVRALEELKGEKEIVVRINSPGGDVFEGAAIYNALARNAANIDIQVDALAASAASVVAMAGDTITMAANSLMMIHNPFTFAFGDEAELTKVADLLGKVKGTIVETYGRTGQSEKQLSQMMDDETWMDAKEAVELGFADEVGSSSGAKASVREGRFRNTPRHLLDSYRRRETARNVLTQRRIAARI